MSIDAPYSKRNGAPMNLDAPFLLNNSIRKKALLSGARPIIKKNAPNHLEAEKGFARKEPK